MTATVAIPTATDRPSKRPVCSSVSTARTDAVRALALVAGEVAELAEHDIDTDGVHEADHHGVGHEPQDRAESQHTGDDHQDPGKE